MKKSVYLLSMNKSLTPECGAAEELLIKSLTDCFGACPAERFDSSKALLTMLAAKIRTHSTVVIAAEPNLFYSAKSVLVKALSLPTEVNAEITASLPIAYIPKSEQEYKTVTQFPVSSSIFPTSNGLLSGFCCTAGKQNIILLPLEVNRINFMLTYSLGACLMDLAGDDIPTGSSVDTVSEEDVTAETQSEETVPETAESVIPAEVIADIPVEALEDAVGIQGGTPIEISGEEETRELEEEPEVKSETIVVEEETQGNTALADAANRTVGRLISTGKRCAVAMSGPYDSLKEVFDATPNAGGAMVFDATPCARWTGGEFNDYLADVAATSRERCETDYAVALSGLYHSEDADEGVFMFFAFAGKDGAKIVKVSGEDAGCVAFDCATKVIEAVGDGCDEPFVGKVEENEAPEVIKSKTPMIIAIIFIIIAVLASLGIGYYLNGGLPDKNGKTAETTVQAQQETAPETTAAFAEESETTLPAEGFDDIYADSEGVGETEENGEEINSEDEENNTENGEESFEALTEPEVNEEY